MKIKTQDLTGPALNWAVAKCEFPEPDYNDDDWITYVTVPLEADQGVYSPSADWAQGGPIIERECIDLECDEFYSDDRRWGASMTYEGEHYGAQGTTPLVAAMRCYVASKLGDAVDIPDELGGAL